MAKFKHLAKEKMEHVTNRLWEIETSLEGLGSLFEDQSSDSVFEPDELFGIGQLVKGQARELAILGDILKCGYDSMAITKDWAKQGERSD